MAKKMTREEFIAKAEGMDCHKLPDGSHKYGYDKVLYVDSGTKVEILCKTHNEYFTQTPNKHLCGRGCRLCAHDDMRDTRKLVLDDFILKANRAHSYAYTYEKTVYGKNNEDKVTITCKIHGDFQQRPVHHLQGMGCKKCGLTKNKGRGIKPKYAEVKKLAEEKFNHKFEYVDSSYRSYRSAMKIICPVHGEFKMTMWSHMNSKCGCIKCEIPDGSKKCAKCGEVKPYWEFHRSNASPDKRSSSCKECAKETYDAPAKAGNLVSRLVPSDRPTDIDGMLFVACKKCGKLFQPSNKQVYTRISKTNAVSGESNFYCSEDCKGSCSIFHAITYHKGTTIFTGSRDCYKSAKASMLENQCDEVGATYCERCGDFIDTDLHHTTTVKEFGLEANQPSGFMLLCVGCHIELHNQCG